jgi:hypothetical protein
MRSGRWAGRLQVDNSSCIVENDKAYPQSVPCSGALPVEAIATTIGTPCRPLRWDIAPFGFPPSFISSGLVSSRSPLPDANPAHAESYARWARHTPYVPQVRLPSSPPPPPGMRCRFRNFCPKCHETSHAEKRSCLFLHFRARQRSPPNASFRHFICEEYQGKLLHFPMHHAL